MLPEYCSMMANIGRIYRPCIIENTAIKNGKEENITTIRKRGNSYQIHVSVGYDTKGNHKEQSMTWRPDEGMTKRQIEKELNLRAVMFEEACMRGFRTSTIKFQEPAEEWFENYAKLNLRSTTYEQMRQFTHCVYPAIGYPQRRN